MTGQLGRFGGGNHLARSVHVGYLKGGQLGGTISCLDLNGSCGAAEFENCSLLHLLEVVSHCPGIDNDDGTGDTDMLLDEAADLSEAYESIEVFEMATAEEPGEGHQTGCHVGMRRASKRAAGGEENEGAREVPAVLSFHPPTTNPSRGRDGRGRGRSGDTLARRSRNNCVLSAYAGQDSLMDSKTGIPALFAPLPAVGEWIRGAVVKLES
ncbi:hypothetical protein C8J57DRAFT_1224815 [Mycena rebaudengoi]|nr:hypothetical protein C8J57DRAFT_1224815 [Mycena rebaudengoi]